MAIVIKRIFNGLTAIALAGVVASAARAETAPAEGLSGWLRALERAMPRQAADFSETSNAALDKAAEAIELWGAQIGSFRDARTDDQFLDGVGQLLSAKNQVDQILDETLDLRRQFASLDATAARHEAMCAFLAATSRLIDLSGRLRYLQVDAVHVAGRKLADDELGRRRLLDRFSREHSSVGAYFAAQLWLAPREGGRLPDVDRATRQSTLRLASEADEPAILPVLAAALHSPDADAELTISIAETIRRIGLPQEPWPDPIEPLTPPPVTPATLHEILARIPAAALSDELARRRAELLDWLAVLRREGLTEPSYRLGSFDVRPGDWLLMRNPSPYNQFTDLSPGLFTHVGVVTLARGSDGVQRMVLVDLPERGDRIPAANIETYVRRSLHYCFLRHPDPEIAAGLAKAARDMIGNESLFDLNFRLQGALALKGQPLAGKKIETYCAGLLLLCTLQTPAPRQEFFPAPEHPRGGNTLSNLAKLGLSMDDDFISPTGAIFSQRLTLVGRREPMYDPRREVEEAVFDHFAWLLANRTLAPSPDWFQSLRLKLAEASRHNTVLARALAKAAGVNAQTDLVSAAKAAAVVETLDDIAFGSSGEFLDAWDFLRDAPAADLAREGLPADEVADAVRYQSRHAALYQGLRRQQLSARQLRIELVKYYTELGKRRLEQRFFGPSEGDPPSDSPPRESKVKPAAS